MTEAKPPAITGTIVTFERKGTMWSLPGVRVMNKDEPMGPFATFAHVIIDGTGPSAGLWKFTFVHEGNCRGFDWEQILDPGSVWCGSIRLFRNGQECSCQVRATKEFVGELSQINNDIPDGEVHGTLIRDGKTIPILIRKRTGS